MATIQFTTQNIKLGVCVTSKEDAIVRAGDLLVQLGYADASYIGGMLKREQQGSTCLGKGLAVPHGLPKDQIFVRRTGISVVQIPKGVEWDSGETVRLVVGIAARSDEHLGILGELVEILHDDAMMSQLGQTANPTDIVHAFTTQQEREASIKEPPFDGQCLEIVIPNGIGLHVRPAALFAESAFRFTSEIEVWFKGKRANGKSVASLLKLGIPGGATIRIVANGDDACAAMEALKCWTVLGFDKGQTYLAQEKKSWKPISYRQVVCGISASSGLAVGPVFHYSPGDLITTDIPQKAAVERAAFESALNQARLELEEDSRKAPLFRAYLPFLQDSQLQKDVLEKIERGHSAAWAWQQAVADSVAEVFEVENKEVADCAADLADVGRRVLRFLLSKGRLTVDRLGILVAKSLFPSDVAALNPSLVAGICLSSGGPTTHAAIIARSMEIPTIVGAGSEVLALAEGSVCILDGSQGKLYVEPSQEAIESARKFSWDLQKDRGKAYAARHDATVLASGHRVKMMANISKVTETAAAIAMGAEGVGLMRTEFLFLNRKKPPSMEEQTETYMAMIRSLNGLPLVLRTLDVGGDKMIPYIASEHLRGLRLCLQQPDLFLTQLRAIFRASLHGPVHILLPMVTTLEDFRMAKELAEKARKEVGAPTVEIGIMVEVPSVVHLAPEFAREADFLSIGTNDLTQYTFACERIYSFKEVDGLHPGILRMVHMTVSAARVAGKRISVCGDVASDPLGAVLFLGLGILELSMNIPSIARIKALLRKQRLNDMQYLARQALACSTAEEVRKLAAFLL